MNSSFDENYNTISKDIITPLNKVFYDSFIKDSATRSSDRTDVLHESIKTIIKSGIKPKKLSKSKYVIKTDTDKKSSQINDGYGKKISCDIVVKSKEDNTAVFALMIKAPISSINKNFQNSYNNLTGEAIRILSHKENKKLVVYFLNFIPRKTFTFDKDGKIKTIENVREMNSLDLSDFGILETNIEFINIYYDINEEFFIDTSIKNKKDIKEKIETLLNSNQSLIKNVDTDMLEKHICNIQNLMENN